MNVPVVITLAVELPDTVPNIALVTHATFAGPPADEPAKAREKSRKSFPVHERSTSAPNNINKTI